MKSQVLIIGGPTATGKTDLALKIASEYAGEILSADSRQVYCGMDIVTGKDIPPGFEKKESNLIWHNKPLTFYTNGQTRIWLTDIVNPDEQFNVSFWHECADLVLSDILKRNHLPIVVGVTGLYISSLIKKLDNISIAPDPILRQTLAEKTPDQLFAILNTINPTKAASLNDSDKQNPRRLVRAIEIYQNNQIVATPTPNNYDFLTLCLTAPFTYLYSRIDTRVENRIQQGAQAEINTLMSSGYSWQLPPMQTSGYRVWHDFLDHKYDLPSLIKLWQFAEHQDARHQLTWFKKQPNVSWFDISLPDWTPQALSLVRNWYNSH